VTLYPKGPLGQQVPSTALESHRSGDSGKGTATYKRAQSETVIAMMSLERFQSRLPECVSMTVV
jgi:hypothetical protein